MYMCWAVLWLLNIAVDCQRSGLPLPIKKKPAPVLVTAKAPVNVLLPAEASLEAPFLVAETVPLKKHPLKKRVGLTVVILPPKAEEGPKGGLPLPVRVRFCRVGPDWVNCRSNSVPAEKPPEPMLMVLPAERLAVAVVLPLQNCTPCPLVELTTTLPAKIVPVELVLT